MLLAGAIEHALGTAWSSAARDGVRLANGAARPSHPAVVNALALLQIIESSAVLAQDRHVVHLLF